MEKLIGGIIRFNREQLGYSIKKVSQEVGVSDGYISRIERNNENPTEEMKKKIFESLNVTYCEENIEDQFENDFRIFYDDVVYTRDFQKSYDVILAYSHIIKSTSSYIKYLVADMVYKGMINQKVNPKDYQFIAGYFDYLEDYQKQIYYDYMGIFSKSMEKTIDALNYYSLAFQYKGIDESKAMVNYHMSMDLKRAGEIQKAIEVAIISRDIFARIVNLKRLTAVSGLLASLYSISGDYEKAELIFMNCIYAFQLIQMEGQLKSSLQQYGMALYQK